VTKMDRQVVCCCCAVLLLLAASASAVETFSRVSLSRGGRAHVGTRAAGGMKVARTMEMDLDRAQDGSDLALADDLDHSHFSDCIRGGGACMSSERCTGGWVKRGLCDSGHGLLSDYGDECCIPHDCVSNNEWGACRSGVDCTLDGQVVREDENQQCAEHSVGTEPHVCCTGGSSLTSIQPFTKTDTGAVATNCGMYTGLPIVKYIGNNMEPYPLVKIHREHLLDPSMYDESAEQADNTLRVSAACAFDSLYESAQRSGIDVRIAAGFRTLARQEYLFACTLLRACSEVETAPPPGLSRHGFGTAIDINTGCGASTSPAPECTNSSSVYQWMVHNAQQFGFARTMPEYPFHFEYTGSTSY